MRTSDIRSPITRIRHIPLWEVLALALLLLTAALVRIHHLGYKSLWLDELVYVRSALGDGSLFSSFGYAGLGHPPGYLFLIRLLLRLGREEWLLRLPAMIASVADVAFLWLLGRQLLGPWAGLLAAAMLVLSPFHLQYAQELHSYALFGLLSTVMLWALTRIAQAQPLATGQGLPARVIAWDWLRTWRWFILASILSLYSHYYAVVPVAMSALVFPLFLLDAHGGALPTLWQQGDRVRRLRELLLALVLIALLFLPQIIWGLGPGLQHASSSAAAVSQGEASVRFQIGPNLLTETFLDFFGGLNRWYLPVAYQVGMAAVLLAGLAWLLWRRRALGVAFLAWTLVPLLPLALYAQSLGISFAARRLIYTLPIFVLTAVAGALAIGRLAGWLWQRAAGRGGSRWVAVAVVGLLAIAYGVVNREQIITYYWTPKQDWKTTAAVLKANMGQKDALLVTPNAVSNLAWYFGTDFYQSGEDLLATAEALCSRSTAIYVVTALTGPQLTKQEAQWLQDNTVQISLKQMQIYYRNCQPGAWYGEGAEPIFLGSMHPDLTFPPTAREYRQYQELRDQQAGDQSTVQVAATGPELEEPDQAVAAVPSPESSSPAPLLAPTATPQPTATPNPRPNPVADLGGLLAAYAAEQPESPAAQVRLGIYLARQGELEAAVGRFQAVLAQQPDYRLAFVAWGMALADGDKPADAKEVYRQGLEALPGDPALTALAARLSGQEPTTPPSGWQEALDAGKAALQARDWQTAIAQAEEAATRDPNSHESQLLLGDANRGAGRLEEALQAYQEATQLVPQFGFLHARQGEVLARLERPQEALEAGLTAVVLEENRWETWLALGRAYAALATTDPDLAGAAEAALKRAEELAPPGNTAPQRALSDFYALQGRPEDAVEIYAAVVEDSPEDPVAQRNLADLQLEAGQVDQALAIYRALADATPQDRGLRMALADALARSGQVDESMATYGEINAQWPDFPWAYVRRAELLEDAGKTQDALQAYQAAVAVDPENSTLYFLLGHAYKRAGLTDQAIAAFESGLELEPDRSSARQALDELRAQ